VLGFPSTVTDEDANLRLLNIVDKVEEGATEINKTMKKVEMSTEKDDAEGLEILNNVVKVFTNGSNIQNVVIDKVEEVVTEIDTPIKQVEVSTPKDETEALGILDNVVKGLTKGSNIQSVVIDKVKEGVVKIDKLMKDVEDKLTEITKEIGVINIERSTSLREAYKTYRRIKVTLKDTRVELKRLAVQTELKTSDLLIYVQAWDHEKYSIQDQKAYLKEVVVLVKQLLEDSKVILTDVKNKYDQAYLEFNTINAKLEDFKLKVDLMLDENSTEHQSWVGGVSDGIFATAGALTAIFAILDATFCVGLCTAFGTTTTWTVSVAAVGGRVAEITTKLEEFEGTVLDSIYSVNEISNVTKRLQTFIEKETNIIIEWHESLKHADSYIDEATEENLYRLTLKRRQYETNLIRLGNAAREIISQPNNIFGENILEKVLADPNNREKEHKERATLRAKALCAKHSETEEEYEKCVKEI
jgi:hypothetical protein